MEYLKTCESCKEEFKTTFFRGRFCSRSCSNRGVKRRKKKEVECRFEGCDNIVDHYTSSFCRVCTDAGRHFMRSTGGKLLTEVTIKEYCPRKGANAYDNIRCSARTSVKDELKNGCEECGWSHHVEVCHIRAISDFPDDTIVSVVNDRSNLKLLCPNCHWVFDHK